jgi:RNA polymerase sigma factor (TIGR02999 family)
MSEPAAHSVPASAAAGEVTQLLSAVAVGQALDFDRLLALVYDELLMIARRRMDGERRSHTLEATALVHEAYLRLLGDAGNGLAWSCRGHFFHAAAEAMRRILIEHARARGRIKRGGDRGRETLDSIEPAAPDVPDDLLALDAAVCRLEQMEPRAAAIVRLRFFGGLSVEDTAEATGTSPRTVKREWAFARAWLYQQLHGGG